MRKESKMPVKECLLYSHSTPTDIITLGYLSKLSIKTPLMLHMQDDISKNTVYYPVRRCTGIYSKLTSQQTTITITVKRINCRKIHSFCGVQSSQRGLTIEYQDAQTCLLFGSHETSPIIWIGKSAPAIQCQLKVKMTGSTTKYHSVCPLVRIGTPAPLPQVSAPPPN